jgi:hypothetical protein
MSLSRSISALLVHLILWMALFGALLATMARAQTPATAFTQSFDWTANKLAILPTTNRGIFKVGEPITLVTSNNILVTVYDLYGRSIYSGVPKVLALAAGHYFVECNGDRSQFAVLPADYVGISYLGDQAYLGFIEGADRQRRIQPGWVRGGAACWQVVQPAPGVWDWSQLDSAIANSPGRKLMAIASTDSAPNWVQPDNLLSNYVFYVTTLVERYKGRVAAVEIWNEPSKERFWGDTNWMKVLADLHIQGSAAIKAVDPTVLVLGPSASSPGSAGLTATLSQYGVSAQIDGLSWHDYWAFKFSPDKAVLQNGLMVAPDIFGRGQAHRDAADFSGPLFITEMGLFARSALGIPTPTIETGYTGGLITNAPDWSLGMTRGVKYAVMYRAAGAEMIMPHLLSQEDNSLTDQQNALYGWEYGRRGPKPKTTAFLMTGYWLNGAELHDYRTPSNQIVLSAWRRANNTSLVFAWAGEGQYFALSNSAALRITDLYGSALQISQITDQPVLFHATNSDTTGLLQSVMSRLPPLNQPPVPAFLPNYTVFKGQPLEFTVKATDPDHDSMVFSGASLPAGASLNPTTGVFSWTPTTNQLGQFAITFTVTDARGLSTATSTLISVLGSSTDGLVGWWKLDETSGTIAVDSAGLSPGSLVGTNGNVAAWVAGRVGNAVALDGSSRYININSSSLAVTNNFTIVAWINPRVVSADQGVFFCLRSRYAESGIKLSVNRRSDLLIEGQTATGWKQMYYALGGIQYNTWQHIVMVYDKSAFAVYINGQRLTPAYGVGNWDGDIIMNPIGVTRIGAEGYGVANYFFDGLIDDVRLYSRTLSLAEVTTLYQSTAMVVRPRAPSNLNVIRP